MSSSQKEIQASYSELVRDGGLAHDLGVKNMRKDFDFEHDQALLLYLVEQLESRPDELSKKLLSKINNLFYLRLHRVLAHFDRQSHCQQGRLVHWLRKLYTHDRGKDGQHSFPFQTALTKMMLQIAIVSTDSSSSAQRNETLLLVFEQAQESLTLINASLGSSMLEEHIISNLIDGISRAIFTQKTDGAFVGLGGKIVTAVIIVASIVVVMIVGYFLIKWLVVETKNQANDVVDHAVDKLHDPAMAALWVRVDHAIELGNRMSDPHGPLLEAVGRASTSLHDTLQNGLRDGIRSGVRDIGQDARTNLTFGNVARIFCGFGGSSSAAAPVAAPAPASSSSSPSSSAVASPSVLSGGTNVQNPAASAQPSQQGSIFNLLNWFCSAVSNPPAPASNPSASSSSSAQVPHPTVPPSRSA